MGLNTVSNVLLDTQTLYYNGIRWVLSCNENYRLIHLTIC